MKCEAFIDAPIQSIVTHSMHAYKRLTSIWLEYYQALTLLLIIIILLIMIFNCIAIMMIITTFLLISYLMYLPPASLPQSN